MKQLTILLLLLSFSIGLKAQSSLNQRLFEALDNKDIDGAKSLIRQGANVNAAYDGSKYSGSKGWTVFVFGMITTNDIDFMRYLINQGANAKKKIVEDTDQSAMHYAGENNMKEMMTFLIDEVGMDINEDDKYQKTPLMYACMARYPDKDFIQYMIDKGASLKHKDSGGSTALNWAIGYQAVDLVKTLVENGSDVNNLSTYGAPYSRFQVNTLGTAISYRNVEIFNYLLSKGADYKYESLETSTLHLAAEWGFPYAINKLLVLGVDKNRKDLDGKTALEVAVKEEKKFEQQLLLYGPSETDKRLFRLMEDDALSDVEISMSGSIDKKSVVMDLDGQSVSLKQYKGKLLLVNFWATWCGPCLREMPSMKSLKDKMGNKLDIIAISVDKEKEKIPEFNSSHGPYPFTYLHDPEWKVYKEFYSALPGSYLISKSGQILASVSGSYKWDDPKVIELIEVLNNY